MDKGEKGKRERQKRTSLNSVDYPAAADCGRKGSESKFLQQRLTSFRFVEKDGKATAANNKYSPCAGSLQNDLFVH